MLGNSGNVLRFLKTSNKGDRMFQVTTNDLEIFSGLLPKGTKLTEVDNCWSLTCPLPLHQRLQRAILGAGLKQGCMVLPSILPSKFVLVMQEFSVFTSNTKDTSVLDYLDCKSIHLPSKNYWNVVIFKLLASCKKGEVKKIHNIREVN